MLKLRDRLEEILNEKQISMSEFSCELLFDLSTVYAWFKEDVYPSAVNMIRISKHFKLTIEYLLGRIDTNNYYTLQKNILFEDVLKQHINKSEKTTSRISKELGLSRSRMHDWLTGKSMPSIDNLIKLADYFGLTIDQLLGLEK